MNQHTPGPLATDDAESGGSRIFSVVNGANVAFTDDLNDRDLKGTQEDRANGALLAASYTMVDKVARELEIEALDLCKIDLAALIEARECLATLMQTAADDGLLDKLTTPEFRARCEAITGPIKATPCRR